MMPRSYVVAAAVGTVLAVASTQVNDDEKKAGAGDAGGSAAGPAQELGRQLAAERYGWTGNQWDCLRELWQHESNWNADAVNASSGAYGIPQILPSAHGRPVPLGDAEAQIEWGLVYIDDRYGDPCAAWSFWQSKDPHWY